MNQEFLTNFAEAFRRIMGYPLLPDTEFTVGRLVYLILLCILIWILELFLRKQVFQKLFKRTRMHPSMQYALARILGYVFIVLGIFVSLQVVGLNLNSLAIFAGAVGVGVGFGLQNIISNFISGIILLAERPVAVGDRVEVSGVGGKVESINLRSTTVITNDNISIIVPNSDFISSAVTNWSHGDPKVRMRIPVGIAYGSDVQKFRQGMLEVARAHAGVLKTPEPDVYFIAFGDSSLNFEVVVWTVEMALRPLRLISDLNYAIDAKLRELDIEIPFPQRDLHIRSSSHSLPVQMESGNGEGRSGEASAGDSPRSSSDRI